MDLNLYDIVQDRGPQTLFYLFIVTAMLAAGFYVLKKWRAWMVTYFIVAGLYIAISIYAALLLAADMFDFLRLLCFAVFPGGCVLSCLLTAFAWSRYKVIASFFGFWILALPLIALDAFVLEPHDLQITHYSIKSSKVNKPLRIAVLTDLQTDHVRRYEAEALRRMMNEKPDLILLPGDYIQEARPDNAVAEILKLRELLKAEKIDAPSGVYAVRGNTEPDQWPLIFAGTKVQPIVSLQTIEQKDVCVTGMTLEQSFDPAFQLRNQTNKFHILFGHCPNFALGNIDADLLVAGHTHGGQVKLPLVGPLITLSKVPRQWAGGALVKLAEGKHLVVARGVGMERRHAPRLRFLCKPEIVIVDVMPI